MFSFFPPLLIILAIAGIIVVVWRRTPEIGEKARSFDWRAWAAASWQALKWLGRRIWHYVSEVKQISRREGFRKFSPKKFPFFRSRISADEPPRDYARAEEDFIKVIKEDPHNEEAFAGLGKLYFLQNRYKEAAGTYRFLVKHHPENGSYFSSLGQACHNLKQYGKAVDAYEKAIELEPDNARRYGNLGATLLEMGHVEEAILNYRRAADMDPENTQFYSSLADCFVTAGQKEEAAEALEKLLQIEPTNQEARDRLMKLKF